jgi:hypothetical protein
MGGGMTTRKAKVSWREVLDVKIGGTDRLEAANSAIALGYKLIYHNNKLYHVCKCGEIEEVAGVAPEEVG